MLIDGGADDYDTAYYAGNLAKYFRWLSGEARGATRRIYDDFAHDPPRSTKR